jgi:hypothetical protein
MRAARIVFAALLGAALAAPAFAQNAVVDYMKTRGLGNPEVEAMTAAENALFARSDVALGAVETWTTPGAAGEARVTFAGPRADGRPCVAVRHAITPTGRTEVVSIPVRRCQAPDGRWLIAAE